MTQWEFKALTAVVDKELMWKKYVQCSDPYAYSLEAILERYVFFLNHANSQGDVMAESRGGREDQEIKRSFKRYYSRGTRFAKPEDLQHRLTSCEIKIAPKARNIGGLQVADLLANPAMLGALHRHGTHALPEGFKGRLFHLLLSSKWDRSVSGQISGYGTKVMP